MHGTVLTVVGWGKVVMVVVGGVPAEHSRYSWRGKAPGPIKDSLSLCLRPASCWLNLTKWSMWESNQRFMGYQHRRWKISLMHHYAGPLSFGFFITWSVWCLIKITGGHCFGWSICTESQKTTLKIKMDSLKPKCHITKLKLSWDDLLRNQERQRGYSAFPNWAISVTKS